MKKFISISLMSLSLFAIDIDKESNTKNIDINVKLPQTATKSEKVNGIIPNSPSLLRPAIIKVSGIGEGVPPVNTVSPAQAKALARRAAIAEAYKSLAEKMYGVRLSAKDRVKDLIIQRAEVRTAVAGIIRGATIDEESWKDGLYKVVLVVHLDGCMWSRYLSSPSLYKCSNR